ncbi:hypothetical protein Tco_1535696 [Tanacetum coccineum]
MALIHEYLVSGLIPEDSKESKKIKIKAPQYKLIRGSLYKKSFYTPWLRCIAPPKTDDVIKEIHEGSCGFNMEPCSMVVRFTKQGYYWPSIYRDIARIIQDYEKCKEQSAVRKRAEIEAIAAGNAWPFKAKPLTTVNARHIERFVWEYVVCRFGVPQITSSKDDKHFKEGRTHGDNKQNREATNSKPTRMGGRFTSSIMDTQNTSKKQPERDTVSLTYSSEAIILTVKSNVAKDDRGRMNEVTKRKESKEVVLIDEAYYQNELHMYDSKTSNHSTYKVGDFVLLLQNNIENPKVWQGSHMIRKVHEEELYKIIDASDHSLIQTAKGTNLRKFYM